MQTRRRTVQELGSYFQGLLLSGNNVQREEPLRKPGSHASCDFVRRYDALLANARTTKATADRPRHPSTRPRLKSYISPSKGPLHKDWVRARIEIQKPPFTGKVETHFLVPLASSPAAGFSAVTLSASCGQADKDPRGWKQDVLGWMRLEELVGKERENKNSWS